MNDIKYYDGTKLLSMKDINGNVPEIYISTSNRSAGKTTYFNRYLVNRFLKYGEKFCLLYRFQDELKDSADKFFKDIHNLFFSAYTMKAVQIGNSKMYELFLCSAYDEEDDGKSCGYAVALNCADKVKKYSHYLSDVSRILLDEFQSETNHYCADEVSKFISIHTSIARGNNSQVRYVPVIMISNAVTLLNPYYTALDITDRLASGVKFLRGDGFVLEQGYNESASKLQESSLFNRAFNKSNYVAYASQNVYLNDNHAFIAKMKGQSRYLCTLKYKGEEYAVKMFEEQSIVYCDKKVDPDFKQRISVTTDDHNINYVMLKNNGWLIDYMRYFFDRGCFRFYSLDCKECILKALAYY